MHLIWSATITLAINLVLVSNGEKGCQDSPLECTDHGAALFLDRFFVFFTLSWFSPPEGVLGPLEASALTPSM
jgi:hypothetical protein